MPITYGPQPLQKLNTETRHGFGDQYLSEQFLESLENDFMFYFDDKRHKTNGNPTSREEKKRDPDRYYQPIKDWKILKERQKTVSAALLLCLNLGVDPPDVAKTHPCARLESWVDPLNFQDSKKAIEQIGKNLQSQYETLSLRTRYKQSLDPCVEDVKRFCNSLRRASKDERILFHYNGHGVPQPTTSGEMWVFNRGYTQYIPVSLYDLQTWLGAPCIYVYDCNSAGNIVTNFQNFVQKRIKDDQDGNHDAAAPSPTQAYTECIQLASCRANELLPMKPELPADLFTCCLTCPIEISVDIFLMQSPLRETKYAILFQNNDERAQPNGDKSSSAKPNVTIPGKLSDRRTPLGELNWIFTAITDTIAWTSLPRPLFKKLFRHDLMVAALFRNFLLAKRIMPWFNCHPMSDPELPDSIADHAMWKSWDLAIDEVLSKLVSDLQAASSNTSESETQVILQEQQLNGGDEPLLSKAPAGTLSTMSLANHQLASAHQIPQHLAQQQQLQNLQMQQQQQQQFTGFFEQNLTAFELWVKYGSNTRHPPEQLPIVLQVLLSQVHRVRALVLLSRFLDLGPWAVYLSLSIGIFPYVLKLLQSPAPELRPILVFIWSRIMSIDYKNTQAELIKEKGYLYFVKMLVPELGTTVASPGAHIQRTGSGGGLTMNANASLGTQRYQLYQNQQNSSTSGAVISVNNTTDEQKAMAIFVLSSFLRDFPLGQKCAFSLELLSKLCYYVEASDVPLLRQWCIVLLGQLYYKNPLNKYICMTCGFLDKIYTSLKDPIPEVRCAALLAINMFLSEKGEPELALQLQQEMQQQCQQLQAQLQSFQSSGQMQRQQAQAERQLQQLQTLLSQLRNMDSRKLKQEEIKMTIGALGLVNDGSPLVRKELIICLSQLVHRYINFFFVVAFNEICDEISQLESTWEDCGLDSKQSVAHGSIFNTVWKSLLILTEDPYLENKSLAQQVVDYIFIKLSDHQELNEVVVLMELYLMKHTGGNGNGSNSGQALVSTLPTAKRPTSLSVNGKESSRDVADQTTHSFSRRIVSLSGLLKSLGWQNDNNESLGETPGRRAFERLQGTNLLSVPHGTAPTAVTPKFKKHTGPIEVPLVSKFLNYSSEYFQEPQMKRQEADEPGSVEYTSRLWRRNRNESIIQRTQAQKKLSLYGDWSNNIATLENKTQPKILKFSQFENYVVSSDDRDNISVIDWVENSKLATFSNGNPFGTKITDIKFLNEDDIPLLLSGSSDGIVKIYNKFHDLDELELVSSWRGLTDLLLTPRSTGLLTEWQQSRGSLLVTGDAKIIRIWDALTETVEVDIPAKSSSLITSVTSDQVSGNMFVAGFSDGSLRAYDRRVDPRDSMVRSWRANNGKSNSGINNVHLQRGGYRELVSGTDNGQIELWDLRSSNSIGTFNDESDKSGSAMTRMTTMTSMQVHEHAPIIATGTKQLKIWTTSGDLLSSFKNTPQTHAGGVAGTLATGMSGSRISNSFISTMAFHPHEMILAAANSHNSSINIYECHDARSDYLYY
ncbi:LANO_0C08394g1_1 [Lachancea nothofagi CBS 11611]|uniref:LANO_0C08394g1_1 n=1 Tax=Lachancea nothofagi CBS 11611 TaxID=1266666 RepID=A0A1G4J995_9SACH|nr:LANO_0C08394g1_1 [Lachancea nothofagi CBS 11611]